MLDVQIELIIPDNTAYTVLIALRNLGYADLKRVERADHFFLSLTDDAPPSEDIVAQLSRAEVLFNPNKHRLSWASGRDMPQAQPLEFEALVSDDADNADRLLRQLQGTFGMTSLRGMERAVAWRLYGEAGPAAPPRLEWACRKLLANAVSQHFIIRPRPLRNRIGEQRLSPAKQPQ